MTALWFSPPAKALDSNADPYSGATWEFYLPGTLTPQAVFADAGLATSLGATVTADSAGKFANIFFDASKLYRAVCKDSTGAVTLHDIDPVNPGYLGPGSTYTCRVTGTGNASLSSASATVIGWGVESYDPSGMHSTAVNSDEIHILVSGTYSVKAKLLYASNSTGYRKVQLKKNGNALVTNAFAAANGDVTVASMDEQLDFVAGDALTIAGEQTSGGNLNVQRPDSYFHVELLRAA